MTEQEQSNWTIDLIHEIDNNILQNVKQDHDKNMKEITQKLIVIMKDLTSQNELIRKEKEQK